MIKHSGYFGSIWKVSKSLILGLGITLRYMLKPKEVVTIQYPHEHDEIPDRHRGIHFLETEKCILCYQCANACPVDCIYIEGTRDGSIAGAYEGKKCEVTRFSIDYGLCLFCNLCIEPCPEDCIHMGKDYDFSGMSRDVMTKNLLTNRVETADDRAYFAWGRTEIERLAEEKKKAKAAAAAAAAAAKAKPATTEAPPTQPRTPGKDPAAPEGAA
jgi:NADH-quinone oxidoreductase subunit I